jgi:hypothetical protein
MMRTYARIAVVLGSWRGFPCASLVAVTAVKHRLPTLDRRGSPEPVVPETHQGWVGTGLSLCPRDLETPYNSQSKYVNR